MTAPSSTQKKLLFVITKDDYFCSHRLPLAQAALAAGYRVAVATTLSDPGYAQQIEKAGIILFPLQIKRNSLHPGHTVAGILALMALYRRWKPDIVQHVAMTPILHGAIASVLTHVPAPIYAFAGLGWLFRSQNNKAFMLRALLGLILKPLLKKGSILVQNRGDANTLFQWLGRPKETDIVCVSGVGIDPAQYPHSPEPALNSQDPLPSIVLPARLLWEKGIGEFVQAARLINTPRPQARFILVGRSDPYNPAHIPLEQIQAWQSEGLIEYGGYCADMLSVYQQAHIICLPSYHEGFPKTLLEAMAAGRPIVTTTVPGCQAAIPADEECPNGLLVPPQNAEALAQALLTLIHDPAKRMEMGAQGRKLAETRFHQDRIHQHMLAFYQELAQDL